jgi:hypothetical protein
VRISSTRKKKKKRGEEFGAECLEKHNWKEKNEFHGNRRR